MTNKEKEKLYNYLSDGTKKGLELIDKLNYVLEKCKSKEVGFDKYDKQLRELVTNLAMFQLEFIDIAFNLHINNALSCGYSDFKKKIDKQLLINENKSNKSTKKQVDKILKQMAKRKSLTKKVRFEVFKRDNFTCQYCGNKAPETILEIDHIKPISKGGDNGIMNLITSCFACNRGKSDRELKDTSIVEKQRQQIEELNLKRQQLEMMLESRDVIKNNENMINQKAIDYFNEFWRESELTKASEKKLSKLVKKYGIVDVLETIDKCYEKYFYSENNENENFNNVFYKIGGFLNLKNKPEYIKDIAYIRGICRNKFNYFNDKYYYVFINKFYKNNGDLKDLIQSLKKGVFANWSSFSNSINEFNDEMEDGNNGW